MAITASDIKRDVKTPSITVAVLTLATTVIALRSPHNGGYGMCPILALTGYLCPTCGGLRAVHDLAHLDFAGAWAMNPFLTLTLPLLAVGILGWWWRAWRGYRAWNLPTPVVLVIAVSVVGFGIFRNF